MQIFLFITIVGPGVLIIIIIIITRNLYYLLAYLHFIIE